MCARPGPIAGGRWLLLAAVSPRNTLFPLCSRGHHGGEVLDLGQVLPGPHFAHLQIGGAGFEVLFQCIWSLNAASL